MTPDCRFSAAWSRRGVGAVSALLGRRAKALLKRDRKRAEAMGQLIRNETVHSAANMHTRGRSYELAEAAMAETKV